MDGLAERLVSWLDAALDRIPRYEDGRWYGYGDWGCQLQVLGRYWRRKLRSSSG